ncbi:head completion/stabilization protein, partial [Pasteurella multocida]
MPSGMIGNQSVLVYRYKRAVYCLALANLYERYASYDTANDGEKKMELLQESINQIRRDARFAINDILGRRRITT